MSEKIKYPLSEEEKNIFRKRLEEVLSSKNGVQVIILWDDKELTDYYQNICGRHLLECIEESAREYAEISNGELIRFD